MISDRKHRSISNNVNITEIIIAMAATTPIIEPILEATGDIAIVAKIKVQCYCIINNYTDFLLLE